MPLCQDETNARRYLPFTSHQGLETPGIGSPDNISLDINVGERTVCGLTPRLWAFRSRRVTAFRTQEKFVCFLLCP